MKFTKNITLLSVEELAQRTELVFNELITTHKSPELEQRLVNFYCDMYYIGLITEEEYIEKLNEI